jgi:streptogramin lyase/predicted RNA-binding Zn-ribbon protein involved in translation (DUF1610 family)
METKNFACTNCGAALDYKGGAATMRCPYCGTSVIVPAELRGAQGGQPKPAGLNVGLVVLAGGIILIAVICVLLLVARSPSAAPAPNPTTFAVLATPQPISTAAREPSAVPTTGLARKAMTIGSAGTGPGLFNRATNVAVDQAGSIYVGDRQGGRVQVFDPTGKFVAQWSVGDSKAILSSLVADRKGRVYATVDGRIEIHDAASGKLVSTYKYPGGDNFDSIALAPDGRLAAMWYQEHPGTLDSREGVQGDLVQFDPQGKVTRVISDVVSAQTDGPERELRWAVDGTGYLYALSRYSYAVFKFTPEGKFINRFGSRGSEPPQPDQFSIGVSSIAVDNQGRVFVDDEHRILVFSSEGRYLATFEVDGSVYGMAIDDKNGLWLAESDQVSKFEVSLATK